jgi:hypothetical protein
MAKNQPLPNSRNTAIATAEASGNEGSPLADLNGKRSRKSGPKRELVKELEATLGLERLKTKSALTAC